jgi:hypothetical protein
MLVAACGGGTDDTDTAAQNVTNEGAGDVIESSTGDTEPAVVTTSSTTTTTTSTTTTTAPTTIETPDATRPSIEVPTSWDNDRDEIFGRYLLFWDALYASLGPPYADPDDPHTRPILEDVLTPEMLGETLEDLQRFQDESRVVVRADDSIEEHVLRVPKVQSLSKDEGHRVLIQDCWIVDFDWYGTDGTFIESDEGFQLFNATLKVVGGEWQLLVNLEQEPDDVGYDWCQAVASDKTWPERQP